MSILGAIIVPHPPLIIPAVGRGREREVQATIDAYRTATKQVAEWNPEAVYPDSRLHRCIVRQTRSATCFVSWKNTKLVTADLHLCHLGGSKGKPAPVHREVTEVIPLLREELRGTRGCFDHVLRISA